MPAGYRRLFLDEGAPMTTLLAAAGAGADAAAAGFAHEVLRAATSGAPTGSRQAAGPSSGADAPTEVLSDRELQVLRLLASDLTGPEIARELFVSVNTLRTHTKHIFSKLDVTTRRAAVRRGAELGVV